jgi:Fe-S cluster assembly iron-binding protein IscA
VRLTLSSAARKAIEKDLPEGSRLRIAFAGGCGALGFRLAVSRRQLPDDTPIDSDGVTVLLDRRALQELDGARLEYDEEEGFVLDHPSWGVSC